MVQRLIFLPHRSFGRSMQTTKTKNHLAWCANRKCTLTSLWFWSWFQRSKSARSHLWVLSLKDSSLKSTSPSGGVAVGGRTRTIASRMMMRRTLIPRLKMKRRTMGLTGTTGSFSLLLSARSWFHSAITSPTSFPRRLSPIETRRNWVRYSLTTWVCSVSLQRSSSC